MKITDYLYVYSEGGMLDCNKYLIRAKQSVLIDTGSNTNLPALQKTLVKDDIKPDSISFITNSHLHIDHCLANTAFKEISRAKILSHPLQKRYYDWSVIQTSQFFGLEPAEFTEDALLTDNKLDLGDMVLEVIPSPGHSPDSVCYYCREKKFLVCGDVLFAQNTGRTDLPGGNGEELKKSIERLSELEIEYLLPGHMNMVTGAANVKNNFKFVRENVFPWL